MVAAWKLAAVSIPTLVWSTHLRRVFCITNSYTMYSNKNNTPAQSIKEQVKILNLQNCENLAFLLGIEKDGTIHADESYMASLLCDIDDCLPELTELMTDDHETLMRSVHALITCSQCFQRCLKELEN